MTVREAKEKITEVLHQLDRDGIRITGIVVNWQSVVTDMGVAKPQAETRCSLDLEAKL